MYASYHQFENPLSSSTYHGISEQNTTRPHSNYSGLQPIFIAILSLCLIVTTLVFGARLVAKRFGIKAIQSSQQWDWGLVDPGEKASGMTPESPENLVVFSGEVSFATSFRKTSRAEAYSCFQNPRREPRPSSPPTKIWLNDRSWYIESYFYIYALLTTLGAF